MIVGKNPTLLNVKYVRPSKTTEECFEVIYKDDEGVVRLSIEKPEIDIWFVKPEYRDFDYNKPQFEMSKMYTVRTKVSEVAKTIASEMGEEGLNFIKACLNARDYKRINQVFKWPYVFKADFQPEYYFMDEWYKKYPLNYPKLSKGFLDIETDIIDYKPNLDDVPNTAHAPVNLVTVILEDTNESWTFVLKPYKPSPLGLNEKEWKTRYEMYESQLKQHEKIFADTSVILKDIHDRFDGMYGYIDYHIREYEKEIDLIADVFRLINNRKPNFMLTWNMRFDIQYLFYRIRTLGYYPESIMCHPDFENKRCSFVLDRSTYLIEKQYDYFYCSSYTQYICQMRLYASVRKSQHKLKSVKLNAIGDIELKDKKVDYEEYGNLTDLFYGNWYLGIIYNIKDVLIQKGIEKKTNDVMTYYMRSHSNLTPYNKIFRETHLLRNVREQYFEKQGWVQSNNLNTSNEDEAEKEFYDDDEEEEKTSFKGAINALPTMNMKIGMKIKGILSNKIFKNTMDYDMGAFYPSCKISSNMDSDTLLCKAAFDNEEFLSGEYINRSLNQTYYEKDKECNTRKLDFTGEAVNNFINGNILSFIYNYLGIPSITDIMKIIYQRIKRKS